MFSAALAATLLFFQAAPAAAPTPAPAADPNRTVSGVTVTGKTKQSEEAAQNVVVCHNEPVLGSLFPKKVCATIRENKERQRDDQEVARGFQRSIIVGPQPM
jgi:hypothetical protein